MSAVAEQFERNMSLPAVYAACFMTFGAAEDERQTAAFNGLESASF